MMPPWPAWLWIGKPLTLLLWLANRMVTWTGLVLFWKRCRTQRGVWLWIMAINALSLGALGVVLFLLR